MINNIIGEDLLEVKRGFFIPTKHHIYKILRINNKLYHCNIITEDVPLPHYRNTDKNERMYSNQRMRLNLIIHVLKNGRFIMADYEWYRWFRDFCIAAHNISALVITGCQGQNDLCRTRIVEDHKSSEHMKDCVTVMGKGIYTVGFPVLDELKDDIQEEIKLGMQKDVIKLHQLIEESNDAVEIPKSLFYVPACSII